ncbi:hypothetical protein J437_LFUL010302 [Ladona fulva]|uniref:EF-hand domain-containing protein n=1 Tax=Ladona fulva TaxID=123851 RepID=A0A8K0KAL7_LADFU|nr:hypothetical protein J437_LFUL010302 [Ladona fulva]
MVSALGNNRRGESHLTLPPFSLKGRGVMYVIFREVEFSEMVDGFHMFAHSEDLPPEQIQVLRKAFDGFDQGKTGSISTDMVAEILRLMGQPFNKKILEELIEEVDADKSGRLEFEEFVTLAAKFIVEEDAEALEKELREAFRLYDKEGNGYIPTSCLREILRELDDQLTNEELDMMIEEIDSDGSGTVDFDEFMEMMTGE